MQKLIDFFRDLEICEVLDVGTGPGNFISTLQDSMPNAKITGVDPNRESLKEASLAFKNVAFKEMVGENLAFADHTFDVASISMALHHLPDVSTAFGEMKRVVKTNGWIIVNELFSDNLNPAQEVHKLMHHFRSKVDRLKGISHNETFTKSQILDLVQNSGLEILFHFEDYRTRKLPTSEEIHERANKMKKMLEEISGRPESKVLAQEIPQIEAALAEHGFEMATRVVVVARVK